MGHGSSGEYEGKFVCIVYQLGQVSMYVLTNDAIISLLLHKLCNAHIPRVCSVVQQHSIKILMAGILESSCLCSIL